MDDRAPALLARYQAIDRMSPCLIADGRKPRFPRRGFPSDGRLSVGNGEAGADRQSRQLIDRIAAGASVREFVLIELFGHTRTPSFAGAGAHHRTGIEPAIDPH